jgi:hypothetical protein
VNKYIKIKRNSSKKYNLPINYPGVSLRAGLSTVSFAQVFWGLKRFMESQKDAAPIPNAIYGKHKVLFSEDK